MSDGTWIDVDEELRRLAPVMRRRRARRQQRVLSVVLLLVVGAVGGLAWQLWAVDEPNAVAFRPAPTVSPSAPASPDPTPSASPTPSPSPSPSPSPPPPPPPPQEADTGDEVGSGDDRAITRVAYFPGSYERLPDLRDLDPDTIARSDTLAPDMADADADAYALRFHSDLVVPETGRWAFGVRADDAVRVIVDGIEWEPDNSDQQVWWREYDLDAGVVDLEIHYLRRGGGASLELEWRAPDDSPVAPIEQWMHPPDEARAQDATEIEIHAAGRNDAEGMLLRIGNDVVASWDEIDGDADDGEFVVYRHVHPGPVRADQVAVMFDGSRNDPDADLRIDKVVVGGAVLEAEDARSTGAYDEDADKCADHATSTEWLKCDGGFFWD